MHRLLTLAPQCSTFPLVDNIQLHVHRRELRYSSRKSRAFQGNVMTFEPLVRMSKAGRDRKVPKNHFCLWADRLALLLTEDVLMVSL